MSQPSVEQPWRFALASVPGSSHLRNGTPCQDASACEIFERADASFAIAVVSDGAGSARLSGIGSRMACQIALDELRGFLESGAEIEALDRGFALALLERIRVVIQRLARRARARPRDFACTILFAVAGPRSAAFGQVGDGAIVISAGHEHTAQDFDWIFWPQQGEYVNQTNFATDPEAGEHLAFEVWNRPVQELALLSDGLQGLVLDQRRKVAHGRFFAPMFATVRRAGPGHSKALSESLGRYLQSRSVLSRTDDDKSLILLTRWTPEPPPALPRRPADLGEPAQPPLPEPTSALPSSDAHDDSAL